MGSSEKMDPVQEHQEERPEPEVHPQTATRTPAGSGRPRSEWKTPAAAAGAAFVVVRLMRLGVAGKLLRVGFRLGRRPAGKMAIAFVTSKMAKRKGR